MATITKKSKSLDDRKLQYENKGYYFHVYDKGEVSKSCFVSVRNSKGSLITHSKIILERRNIDSNNKDVRQCLTAVLDRLDFFSKLKH